MSRIQPQLEDYDHARRHEWDSLLHPKKDLHPAKDVSPWVKARASRIVSCVPALGEDLTALLKQLGLQRSIE